MRPDRRTRIKFCGITRLEDALLAAELGVDFLGLVLVPESPRYLAPAAAAAICRQLPASIQTVVLLQNHERAGLQALLTSLPTVLVQFHGRESPAELALCLRPWIKAVPMGEPQSWADWERDYASAFALLADSHSSQQGGGSGLAFDWSALPPLSQRRLPLMLAGGLKPETVGAAIAAVRPWAVDVSSGIESAKGIKDASRMRAFVAAVRAADVALNP